jgi:hypothetical protein
MFRSVPFHSMQAVGQKSTISAWMSVPLAAYSRTLAWLTWMSSFQVPMTEQSERAMEATQSFGHPENLNLYL